jgi:hypothetical protein
LKKNEALQNQLKIEKEQNELFSRKEDRKLEKFRKTYQEKAKALTEKY